MSDDGGDLGRLGNYRLLKKLGEGGMGTVFLAEHAITSRLVAIKVLSARHAGNLEFISRFRREANAAAKLKHDNIVPATASGEEDGQHFYVMEYFDGEPLDKALQQKGWFPALKATSLVRQIALGLKHAHENGVLHRDIKPGNLFLTTDGVAKILDLGLSKNIEAVEQSFNTESGVTLGTPHYISPEQARGERELDGRTDIYSLGATFYHLVTGETPFKGATAAVVMTKHLNEQLENPKDVRSDIPEGVVHVICKMMGKAPSDRYADCAELLADLDLVLAGRPPVSSELEAQLSTIAMPRQGAPGGKWRLPLWSALVFPPLLVVILIQRRRQIRFSLRTLSLTVLLIGAVGAFLHVLPEWVLKFSLKHPESVGRAVFSADSKRIATQCSPGLTQVWETESGKLLADWSTNSFGDAPIAISPDGLRIATAEYGGKVRIFDVKAKKQAQELNGHTRTVNSVAFSPDGTQLVTAAGDMLASITDLVTGAQHAPPPPDDTARVWDVETGKELAVMRGHAANVKQALFSPDGTKVVTAGLDNTARVWDAKTSAQLAVMTGHSDKVIYAALSSDGKGVYTVSLDNTVRRWDAATGKEWNIHVQRFKTGEAPYFGDKWGAAFLAFDGPYVLTSYYGSNAAVWWVHSGELVTDLPGHNDNVLGGDFSKDGKYIVTASKDQTAKVWESRSAKNSPYGIFRAVTFLLMLLFAGLLAHSVWRDYKGLGARRGGKTKPAQ